MKDVIISIKGIQQSDEPVELVTDGKYCYGADKSVLTYMESELTGMEGTKTTFTIDGELTTLVREGSMNSNMVFQEGRKHFFLYETPYGSAMMGVDTRKIDKQLGEHGGKMAIDYFLDMDSVSLGRSRFEISIKEA